MAKPDGAGSDLDGWLTLFLGALGHIGWRTWAPLYLRGLLGPGERKSLQPMAARLVLQPGFIVARPSMPVGSAGALLMAPAPG